MTVFSQARRYLTAASVALSLAVIMPCAQAQTLPGTFSYSWVGNSFMDQNTSAWVPDEVRDLCVAGDGTVFTAGYAESGGSGASYKNGFFSARFGGFNSGFGDPVKAVTTDGTNVYWGGGNGVQVYGYASSNSPNSSILSGVSVTGVCYKSGELYISDFTNNLIRVYSTSSLTQSRQWSCTRPGKIVVDSNNHVWVIQYASGSDPNTILTGTQILSFSNTGTPGASITDVTDPLAIAVNNSNQLLVGGLDQASQVRIYGNLGGTPSLASTFGTNGGIFSGIPGEHQPLKFHHIRGLGVDAAGNIYVCMMYGAQTWAQSVEAYSPSGTLLWQVHGMDYVECAAMDPTSETDIYDHQHHYTLDYSQTNGKEWSFKGFTVNRFKYPNDDRVTFSGGFRAAVGMFQVSGKKFLVVTDQGGYPLQMYRFNPTVDGEVAIPSVTFSGGNETISRDANGNGQFDSGESAAGVSGWYQYFDVTPSGNVLRIGNAAGPATITYYPCQGLDSAGNPIYSAATSTTWNAPPEFSCIRKVVYDQVNDIMYVGGNASSTVEDAVVRLCRYNNWSGARTKAWDVTIPYNDTSYTPDTNYGAGAALSVRQTGQYVFIQYGYGYIRVHDKDTGAYLGTIKPSLNGFNGGGGQVDITHGMTAYKRANGEYVIFTEDAGHNHVAMVRWNPGGATPTVSTPTFSPVGGTYTSSQSVTISDATSGAAIHYTTDGSTPTASSATYSSAITVSSTTTIKAIATKSGSTNSAVASATYTINTGGTEAAFNGPHNIPGTVQAEDYDTGGEGVAYHDTDASNNGGQYRTTEGVDLETTTDTGGGYNVGWAAAGEYLKYTVVVGTAGSYTVGFRVAAISAGNTFHLENASGTNLTGTLTCPNTGAWQTFQTVNATVTLPAGSQVLKLVEDTGGYNFNWISFTSGTPTAANPTFSPAGGTYTSAQSVTLSDSTSGATIRYTTDGSTPTASSTAYSSPISVTTTKTIKAIAIASGYNNSAVASATYTITTASGSLTGSGTLLTGTTSTVNLTSQGTTDWAQWGAGSATDFNHKSSGGSKISNYAIVGSGSVGQNSDNDPRFSWTDGTPTASNSGTTGGIFLGSTGNGFSFTVPADTTQRTLKVYVYGWNSVGQLNAHLSDSSAADYTNSTAWTQNGNGNYYACYTLTYKAASAGKTLTVKWTLMTDNGGGAVGIQAATLQ